MDTPDLELLGISESRWTGSGQKRLATGQLLLFLGREEDNTPHSQGVALMLTKTAQRDLIGWEAHGPRIIMACFRTTKRRTNMDIIQCYAPTNESDEDAKEEFYSRLLTIVQSHPTRNIIITMGDFNSKIGSNNQSYEEIMGQQVLGEMNDNGERFVNMCATSNVVTGGSFFHHKRIHKATWVSPDLSTENQIDLVCIGKKFRGSLQNVRIKRGADVASDRHLLVAHIQLKLKRNRTRENNQRQRYDTTPLKVIAKIKQFKITLSMTSTWQEVLGNKTTWNGSQQRHWH